MSESETRAAAHAVFSTLIRMLEKRPQDRYPTAAALLSDELCSGSAKHSRRASRFQRFAIIRRLITSLTTRSSGNRSIRK
jgi:hypothetical protein